MSNSSDQAGAKPRDGLATGRQRQPRVVRAGNRARTREAIRRAAITSMELDGFSRTTMSAIAKSAGVSERTVFRTFASKQMIIVENDAFEPVMDVLQTSAGLDVFDAWNEALAVVIRDVSDDDWRWEVRRTALFASEPELAAVQGVAATWALGVLSEAVARRIGCRADDVSVRSMAGVLLGVLGSVDVGRHENSASWVEAMQETLLPLRKAFTIYEHRARAAAFDDRVVGYSARMV